MDTFVETIKDAAEIWGRKEVKTKPNRMPRLLKKRKKNPNAPPEANAEIAEIAMTVETAAEIAATDVLPAAATATAADVLPVNRLRTTSR